MTRLGHALAGALLFLCASTAHAACNTTLSPGADVTATANAAIAGSTICLNPGTYFPPASGFPNTNTFAIGNAVTVIGLGATPASVVLQGGSGGNYAVFFTNYQNNGKVASGSTLQNLTIQGSQGGIQVYNFNALPAGRLTDITLKDLVITTVGGGSGNGLLLQNNDRINIDNVTVTAAQTGINLLNTTTSLVMNSTITSTTASGAVGFAVQGGSGNVIVGNTIGQPKVGATYSFNAGGVVFYSTSGNRFENNTIQGHRDDGLDWSLSPNDLSGFGIPVQLSTDNYAGKNNIIATGFADGRNSGSGMWANCGANDTWMFANDVHGAPECGACVYTATSNMLLGNNLHDNGIAGVVLSGASNTLPFCSNVPYQVKPTFTFLQGNAAYFNKLDQVVIEAVDTTLVASNHMSPRNVLGGPLRSDCTSAYCQSAITLGEGLDAGTTNGLRIVANTNHDNIRGIQADDGKTTGVEFAYNRWIQTLAPAGAVSFDRYNLPSGTTFWDGGPVTGGNYWTLFTGANGNPGSAVYGTSGVSNPAQGVFNDLSNNTGRVIDRYPYKSEDFGRGTSVTVFEPLSPGTGWSIAQGTRRTVRWYSPGCSYDDISLDGSTTLATNLPNTGYAVVTIPLATTVGTHNIVVTCKDSAGNAHDSGSSLNFNVSASTLQIMAPGRDDVFNAGSQIVVAWKKSAAIATVAIDLSTDGGVTFPTSLGTGLAGTSARVTLPAIASTAYAVIRVKNGTTMDYTDGVFAIRGASGAGFANVPVGRKFVNGQLERLEWASPQNSRLVDITATVGATVKTVASNLPDRGSFDWVVPEMGVGTMTLAMTFKTNAGATISSTSTTNGATLNPTTITFAPVSTVGVGNTITVAPATNSGLAATLTSLTTGVCTVSGTTVTAVSAGTCTLVANQAGNGSFAPASQVTTSFTVATSVNPPRLANISTRMQVLTGNDVMIGGFVIGGSANKTVAIVATGPSLTAFGIPNALANPTLTLVRSSDQTVIATNDDWQSASNASQLQAAGFAPSNALESAILINLPPGAYTAIVSGVSNGTGVGLVAVYEVDRVDVPLVNISTRGKVLTGNDVMIGGFVIQGSGPQQVAIVATGPSLSAFGITNPLADPSLTLVRSSDQTVIVSNDNWQSASNASQLQAAGFAPSNPLEAAILVTLQPGAYTAIVSGMNGSTGVSVVAVYTVP